MYKIGIIGSDSSHALDFTKLLNIPDVKTGEFLFPDFRATHVFGLDKSETELVFREGKVDSIAASPEDMIGKIDAAMILFRHGDLHAEFALPFIRTGMPVWVDKPFTIKPEEAAFIADTAIKHGSPINGGSTLKYLYDVLLLKNTVENNKKTGRIYSGFIAFPAFLNSEYGGFSFYSSHAIEMCLTIFGYDAKSVIATVNNGNVAVIVKYDRYHVFIDFSENWTQHLGIIRAENRSIFREIDMSFHYKAAFTRFADMVVTGRMPHSFKELLAPVFFNEAVIKSIESGLETYISQPEL